MSNLERDLKLDSTVRMITYHEDVLATYNQILVSSIKTITTSDDSERVNRAKEIVNLSKSNIESALKSLESYYTELNKILEL